MTIDRNRIKLELLNFRNYAEIYADSRNLITEYERNDNKITAAERHDIRLTKLEKNAKAKIPFKELFDRYAELKASDTNPFSTDVFALSLIERRNPLVKQAFEILGTERVRELKYNYRPYTTIWGLSAEQKRRILPNDSIPRKATRTSTARTPSATPS